MSLVNNNKLGVLPTYYTITLYNLLEFTEHKEQFDEILSDLSSLFDNSEILKVRGNVNFIDLFTAYYNQREINSTTEGLWFLRLKDKAVQVYNRYYEIVNKYYKDLDLFSGEVYSREGTDTTDTTNTFNGTTSDNVVNIELPNKVTAKEYPSSKSTDNTNSETTTTDNKNKTYNEKTSRVNLAEQKDKVMKLIRNVAEQAVQDFDELFLSIY